MCLLPLAIPITRRRDLGIVMIVEALLAALTVAINPACVPFLAFACLVALSILGCRATTVLHLSWPRILAWQAGLAILSGVLIVGCDAYYRGLILNLTVQRAGSPNINAHVGITVPDGAEGAFSLGRAVQGLGSLDLAGLTPEKLTFPLYPELVEFHGWQLKPPHVFTPGFTLGLALMYLVWYWRVRKLADAPAGLDPLAGLVVGCLALWLLLKVSMSGLAEGLSFQRGDTALLSSYVRLMLVRCELLLIATCLAASGTGCFLLAERRLGRSTAWRAGRGVLVLLAWVPYAFAFVYTSHCGFVIVPTPSWADITPDDLRLVTWIDSHLSPEDGRIGLAAHTFHLGLKNDEHHIYPIAGAQAVQLYGRQYNFCFTLNDPGRYFGPDAYNENIRDVFHGDWCLRQGIRYFYVPDSALAANPGLRDAVRRGRLKPIQVIGSSGLYEVQAGE
jgi:hypothetical protein